MKIKTAALALTPILFSVAAVASEHGEAAHHAEGVPASVYTHMVNLAIFVGVLWWALFKKADLPKILMEQRIRVSQDLTESQKTLSTAELHYNEVKHQLEAVDKESKHIIEKAEQQALSMVSRMKTEAQSLSHKMVEEAKVAAEHELTRLKEDVVSQIVAEAMEKATKVIETQLESKRDEAVVQRRVKEMEG